MSARKEPRIRNLIFLRDSHIVKVYRRDRRVKNWVDKVKNEVDKVERFNLSTLYLPLHTK